MSPSRWIVLAVSLVFAIASWLHATERAEATEASSENPATEAIYLAPETFLSRGLGDDFIAYAKQFLADHPAHESAPRAAFDLLMASTVRRDTATSEGAAATLIFEHPRSLQASYWLAGHGQNHAEYKKFLQSRFEKMALDFDAAKAQKFCRAIEMGVRAWGPGFVSGDDFLLQVALAAEAGQALNIKLFCREKLHAADEKARQIAEIGFADAPIGDKFLALAEIDDKLARHHKLFYLQRLSAADRAAAEVRRAMAMTLLAEKKFSEALPIVESLLAEAPSDELLYWQAWCLASTGNDRSAFASLTKLIAAFPDGDYAASAVELSNGLSSLDERLEEQAGALARVLERLQREKLERLEAKFTFTPKNSEPLHVHMALDYTESERIEATVTKGAEVVLAVKISTEASRLYAQGDATIHEYIGRKAFLKPQVKLTPNADGTIAMNWGAGIQNMPAGFTPLNDLVKIEGLNSQEGLLKLLRQAVGRGFFPVPPTSHGDEQVFASVWPTAASSQLSRLEIHVEGGNIITSFKSDSFACPLLRYGKRSDFEFSRFEWPEAPVTKHGEFDAPAMMNFLGAALKVFQTEKSQAPSASAAP